MDHIQYFKRIGISEDEKISHGSDFISKLQYQHVTTVPYENLDILSGIPISLDVEDVFNKVVIRKRGGYCFELNALFRELLTSLGLSVKSYFARYWRGELDIPLRRHHVLTVDTDDGLYVCDVGIGQIAPRYPLKLVEGLIQKQNDEEYKFECDPNFGWILYELRHGEWQKYFSFTYDEAIPKDFIQPSFYCEKHPSSPFNKDIIVAMKTPVGRKSLNGRCYKEFQGKTLINQEDDIDDARLSEILCEQFGIII